MCVTRRVLWWNTEKTKIYLITFCDRDSADKVKITNNSSESLILFSLISCWVQKIVNIFGYILWVKCQFVCFQTKQNNSGNIKLIPRNRVLTLDLHTRFSWIKVLTQAIFTKPKSTVWLALKKNGLSSDILSDFD